MSLDARALSFGYGRKTIGRSVTLSVAPGEIVALLGPNGSGKTTLLKTMLGLLTPHGGNIILDGHAMADLTARARAQLIAYVPQVHAATFPFSVRDIVLMGRTAYQGLFSAPSQRDHAITDDVIEAMGLRAFADRPYNEISGGERQLALIARAVAQEPRYIILDEPTASLDLSHQGAVMAMLQRLAADGKGVLFTTHDPNQAYYVAQRAALIREGALLIAGPVHDVITPEQLERLYGAPVKMVSDGTSVSFLPLVR